MLISYEHLTHLISRYNIQIVAIVSFVIGAWEGVLITQTGTDVIGILSVVRDRFAIAKEGVLTPLLLVSVQGILNAV